MDHAGQALPSTPVLREGRRRLRLLLSGLGAAACVVAMVLVLVFYGLPYNPLWWATMAAILVAAAVVSGLCAPVIEWVAKGYLERPAGD